MDRAERNGLGVATAGHVLLFGALSLGLLTTSKPKPPIHDPMEVQLVDEIGLRSAMPEPAPEPPAPSEAPEVGPPEEVAPAEATPSPPEPEPKPAPPQPKPKPAPVPKPQPKPVAAKPTPDQTPRRRPDKLVAAPTAPAKPVAEKPRGSRLGPDFLKGISPEKSPGKAATPRAATLDARAVAGLAAAIAAQVRPCYVVPAGGTDATSIITVLNLRLNKDGTVAGQPTVREHGGITPANQSYVRQMDDAARRAVLRCSPLRLPPDLFELPNGDGWNNIDFIFNPQVMGG
jgi:outer membrane biosynthesis protein TonB